MGYANNPENFEKVKQSVIVYESLKATTEELHHKVIAAGYKQRNILVSHVYSNYNKHEELISAKVIWERLVFEHRVHKKLLEYLQEFRDLFGYFPDYQKMIIEFDSLLNLAIKNEEFEIAELLKRWRGQFPNP